MTPANGHAQQGVGVPCLIVDDLTTAVDFYRDRLGFDLVLSLDTDTTRMALLRGYGAGLLLQESGGQAPEPRRPTPMAGPWNAALLVNDLDALLARLRASGTDPLGDPVPAFGSRFFDFVDCAGNVICVGEGSAALFGAASRGAGWRGLLFGLRMLAADRAARLRSAAKTMRHTARHREHLREFRQFYQALPEKHDLYYTFFTSGLLHWAVAAEAHVPADTNLVILGSDLTEEERAWIGNNLDRPFHHLRPRLDDIVVWQYLFEANERNFGWLDIDCFVLNPAIFAEMAKVAPQVSMNCAWAMESEFGFPVAGTHLLFQNVEAIRAVRSAGVPADPGMYDWTGSDQPPPQVGFYRVPNRRIRRLLRQLLPDDGTGRPRFITGDFYDTLMAYQVIARALGYPVHQVRTLGRRCTLPVDAESTDPAHWPEDVSEELFHLCGISYYTMYSENPGIHALYLAAELVMLDNLFARSVTKPPKLYADKRSAAVAGLAKYGIAATEARGHFRRHLINGRRLDEATADRVLDSGRQRARHAMDMAT